MYQTTHARIGSRIRALRRQKGITAAEFARRVGVTENAIRKLESGDSKEPRLTRALRIAEALGVSSGLNAREHNARESPAPNLAVIIREIRKRRDAFTDHGIRHMRIFGSVARGEAHANSDIDLIIQPERASQFTLLSLVSVRDVLEKLFGHRVDVITDQTLNRSSFRHAAEREAIIVF